MPIGEILSLASAITWGISVSLFKIIGNTISPYVLNPLKNTIGTVLFILTCIIVSDISAINNLSISDYFILALSGVIGIAIADVLFLISLNILGTSRSSIINTVYSPMVIILAYFILGETLTFIHVIGGMLILGSILYLSLNADGEKINDLNRGLMIGVTAYSLMALGIIMVKPILNKCANSIDTQLWIILFRLVPGTLLSYITMSIMVSKKEIINQLSDRKIWPIIFLGSFLGTYIGFAMWIIGMAKTSASIASILNQTSTIFIAFFGWLILKETFSRKMMVCFFLALVGAFIIIINPN
jgi:drug/metabolite transporter (DMT)-like permease